MSPEENTGNLCRSYATALHRSASPPSAMNNFGNVSGSKRISSSLTPLLLLNGPFEATFRSEHKSHRESQPATDSWPVYGTKVL